MCRARGYFCSFDDSWAASGRVRLELGGCAVSRQLDSRLSCCRVFYNNLLPDPAATMYNLYPPAALGKGGSITQGSHHRPIRSGQEEEEEEEGIGGKKFGDLIYLS